VARAPDILGQLLGSELEETWEDDMIDCLLTNDPKLNSLALGYLSKIFEGNGWEFFRKYLPSGVGKDWMPEQKLAFIRIFPSEPKLWNLIRECGEAIDVAYWGTAPAIYTPDAEQTIYRVTRILDAGRPFDILGLLSLHKESAIIPTEILVRTLRDILNQDQQAESFQKRLSAESYHIAELLALLSKREDFPQPSLAELEWAYLPLLKWNRHHVLTLHDWLSEKPGFFVEVVSWAYAQHSSPPKEEISPEDQRKAQRAWELLDDWAKIPGSGPNDTIDAPTLAAWVDDVITQASNADRLEAAQALIGKVMSNSPNGTDGFWPHEAVRNIIEAQASERMDRSFEIGKRNTRGVTSRSLDTGGAPERALVKFFSEQADHLSTKYPRTAAILRRLAAAYESDAKEEDLRVRSRFK
jgi:hypothetical protein